MRLIKVNNFLERHSGIRRQAYTDTDIFETCEDVGTKYCIISHRWVGQEVKYKPMKNLAKLDNAHGILDLPGYQKILEACNVAKRDRFEYLWIDTCCIDKRSSSELTEAINSMFRWYKNSEQCYAYLHDTTDFPTASDTVTFAQSHGWPQWFSRGWTLQELIAPKNLRFFNKDWKEIGDKRSKATELEQITRVPASVLKDGLSSYNPSFAEVMSWAAERTTAVVEDQAYSLLGLLGVNMPMLYGEGKKAFQRLQLVFMQMSTDQSIFAWAVTKPEVAESTEHGNADEKMEWTSGVLADGPGSFRGCDDIIRMEPQEFYKLLSSLWQTHVGALAADVKCEALPPLTVTNLGIRIVLPLRPYYGCRSVFQVALACRRRGQLAPLTIDLAASRQVYYRYSGLNGLQPQPFPGKRRLHLAYRDEIPRDGITFKLVGTEALYGFHRHPPAFPPGIESRDGLLHLSSTKPLAIVVYANASNVLFAVACGYCFGQGWVHVICDKPLDTSPRYAQQIYTQTWNRGAEYARLMPDACTGNVSQPYYVKYGQLCGTVWAVRIAYGGWEQSSNHIVTVDVVEFPGVHCKALTWEHMHGTNRSMDADVPCLMRETSWPGGRLDGHQIKGTHQVYFLAPTGQEIRVGDYGVVSNHKVGDFEVLGNIFDEMKAPKLTVGQYTNVTPLGCEVTSRFKPYGTPLTSTSQDAGLGLELHEPKMHSLMDTQRVLDELKRSSARMRDYSLVTSVVQCSACSLTADFKARVEKQMRRYPRIWQGYVRDATAKPQVVTPLYRIAIPWVWYQGEPDRKVRGEYQMIWKHFSVMTGYPPGHHKKFKDEAVKFFENVFGVEHLESLVGQVAFFEHLLLNELPNDLLKSLPESRIKKLSADLINSMSGVTNEREDNWFSAVKRSVSVVQRITDSDTLALEFVVDISDTFPQKAEALNEFTTRTKISDNIPDYKQSLVKEVKNLQGDYYKTEDSSEQLALEEDIVGKILEVVNETLNYETTNRTMDLPEKGLRFECLKISGEFFRNALSEVPQDSTAHLRRLMANARDKVSMHKLYCRAREERRSGGFGSKRGSRPTNENVSAPL